MDGEKPHYTGHRQRLKQKYRTRGPGALEDYEALELLLFHAVPRGDVKPTAKELIRKFGGLKGVMEAGPEDLEQVEGSGPGCSLLIGLVKEIAVRSLDQSMRERPHIGSTPELVRYCRAYFSGMKEEQFRVIYLDSRHHVIDVETLQEGTVNQAAVYPRKVLERALRHKASGIIMVHNHPSGHTSPSPDDLHLTRLIAETARKLDIEVHDHLIIGGDNWYSLRERGEMPENPPLSRR